MARRLIVFLVVTVGVLAAAFFGLTRRFTVPSNAMEPTMKSGDHVSVFRWFSSPGRKDVVVVRHDEELRVLPIKRLEALKGNRSG